MPDGRRGGVLRFTSCQAGCADSFVQMVATEVGAHLRRRVAFVGDMPWRERERLFNAGRIDVAWICGLPYVWRADQEDPPIELLCAPVMAAGRYGGRPIYFSDIVVAAEAPFRSFADLRDASFAYNEPHSHSGHNIVQAHLADRGETAGFFGRVVESGAHATSLRWIAEGRIDASAIDSTVLEHLAAQDPVLAGRLRVIATLGPSTIPPWVVRKALPASSRTALREALLTLHERPGGRAILERAGMTRFVPITDDAY
ncbi:MAG TPA: PhnD/SsuA/transferrin family substrate-binding protein, partial [Candidatus Polarisedimenticolia bacterium]|nr:PhnD/SsuA/transferrin family substrate-binding protein [Candidatus Polarisedimenticolia bacterium]